MIKKNIALAGAIAVVGATAANAETIAFSVELIDINGIFLADGTGSLTYDDDVLAQNLSGDISITGAQTQLTDPTLSISMSLGGIAFSEDNDVDASDFPIFQFFDGNLDFVDYEVVDGENGVDLSSFGIAGFFLGGPIFARGSNELSFTAQELPSAIPLPTGGLLLISALGMGVMAGRKRKA